LSGSWIRCRSAEQHADAVRGEVLDGRVQKADGGFGFLIGQHLSKSHARVIVNGHVLSQEAGVFLLSAQPSITRRLTSEKRVMPLMSRCSMSPGRGCSFRCTGGGGFKSRHRLSFARRRMQLTEAGLRPMRRAIS